MDALKKEKDKHLGLRIDSELHYKLHYISQYEGRSANGEVIYLIRKAIEDFEKEHGKIEKQYVISRDTTRRPEAVVNGLRVPSFGGQNPWCYSLNYFLLFQY